MGILNRARYCFFFQFPPLAGVSDSVWSGENRKVPIGCCRLRLAAGNTEHGIEMPFVLRCHEVLKLINLVPPITFAEPVVLEVVQGTGTLECIEVIFNQIHK